MTMNRYYADLHIHIGGTEQGAAVKISGSRELTFYRIARESSERKGIDITGIIDCHAPVVQEEIEGYIRSGQMIPLDGGGLRFGQTTIVLGCEIEVREPGYKPLHLLVYMPDLLAMRAFTSYVRPHMRNVNLSSQRLHASAFELQEQVAGLGGCIVPAHIFTPHKSLYGSGATSMNEVLDPKRISGVELGLSSNTEMADTISELSPHTFVTNSDAHSLAKIAREYNEFELRAPTFSEVRLALERREGRRVAANYGLSPKLGKYHESAPGAFGVAERIALLADRRGSKSPPYRPPYFEQVPLEFMPGLGPKLLQKLLDHYGTEMNVLHRVPVPDLAKVAGSQLAELIGLSRQGALSFTAGGGGKYGKVAALQPYEDSPES